jgi:probable rRNA maturation factor
MVEMPRNSEEPSLHVHVDNLYLSAVDTEVIVRLVEAVLSAEGKQGPVNLSVVITGDSRLQDLNREYLGIDQPTDVLAFPSGEIDPDTGHLYLGDVLISYPQAERQAAAGGQQLEDELRLLVVHGVLHLLGFDHADPQERQRMWTVQDAILASFQIHPD